MNLTMNLELGLGAMAMDGAGAGARACTRTRAASRRRAAALAIDSTGATPGRITRAGPRAHAHSSAGNRRGDWGALAARCHPGEAA